MSESVRRLLFIILLITFKLNAGQKIFQIEISEATERSLYGGLGSSSAIGEVTEFFVPELWAPLVSIGGSHADVFKSKIIYIFKTDQYYLCPTEKHNNKCFKCPECNLSETQKNFKRFDVANRENTRKKLIKTFSYPAMIDQGENNRIEFQAPVKGSSPLSLTAAHAPFGKNVDALTQFRYKNKMHVLKSEDDPKYYLCPEVTFSNGCYECIDCVQKIDKIKSYIPPK